MRQDQASTTSFWRTIWKWWLLWSDVAPRAHGLASWGASVPREWCLFFSPYQGTQSFSTQCCFVQVPLCISPTPEAFMDLMFAIPQIHMLILASRWWYYLLWEVISALTQVPQEAHTLSVSAFSLSPSPSPHLFHVKIIPRLQFSTHKRPSPKPNHAVTLISNFQPPELWKINLRCLQTTRSMLLYYSSLNWQRWWLHR
jgi:hypothetical protein